LKQPLKEVFQDGHKFPIGSKLKKLNVMVLKKEISFCVKKYVVLHATLLLHY